MKKTYNIISEYDNQYKIVATFIVIGKDEEECEQMSDEQLKDFSDDLMVEEEQ